MRLALPAAAAVALTAFALLSLWRGGPDAPGSGPAVAEHFGGPATAPKEASGISDGGSAFERVGLKAF